MLCRPERQCSRDAQHKLHGLPQTRCERCSILHFACPECGHHQPINTLRPAAQRVLARLRFVAVGLWVLFKLNFFGWLRGATSTY